MEIVASYFGIILDYLVFLVEKFGYFGIFVGMFLESTFVPIPSEIIMIPAGISVAYGGMNLYAAIAVGVVGNVAGALFNYFLCAFFGRGILLKIGKYFFIKEKIIIKIEEYFNQHGEISTFVGRLIPGVRHYISLPAGIARMNLASFCFYTFAGSLIWVIILTYLGFLIGDNMDMVRHYLHSAVIICLLACAVITTIYVVIKKRRKANVK